MMELCRFSVITIAFIVVIYVIFPKQVDADPTWIVKLKEVGLMRAMAKKMLILGIGRESTFRELYIDI